MQCPQRELGRGRTWSFVEVWVVYGVVRRSLYTLLWLATPLCVTV